MKERPVCNKCQKRKGALKERSKTGVPRYRATCDVCRKKPYAKYKKDYCEVCGFVAVHPAQLDVDHIDGEHFNNEPSNLQTLCANCHRLKTILNGDHLS